MCRSGAFGNDSVYYFLSVWKQISGCSINFQAVVELLHTAQHIVLFCTFSRISKKAVFESVCYFITIVLNATLEICLVLVYGALGAAIATITSYMPYTILVSIKAVHVLRHYKRIYAVE